MYPGQARRFVGSELGPNILQKLLVDDTRNLRVNYWQIKKLDLLEARHIFMNRVVRKKNIPLRHKFEVLGIQRSSVTGAGRVKPQLCY